MRWNLGVTLREQFHIRGIGKYRRLFKSILYVDLLFEIKNASF